MARPAGSKNKFTFEFQTKFEKAVRKYKIDPVNFMFQIMAGKEQTDTWNTSQRLEAAKTLVSYRYPKLRSIEHQVSEQTQLTISWADSDSDSDNNSVQPETSAERVTH